MTKENKGEKAKDTKQYKVHMSKEAYHMLTLEAALKHETIKDAVSRLVQSGIDDKTIAALKAAGEIVPSGTKEQVPKDTKEEVPEGTKEQVPKDTKEEVPEGTKEQSPQEPKSPFALLPPSSEQLSFDEQVVLEHLLAGKTYRQIQDFEEGKTGIKKGRIQSMAQKFVGMGLFQGGKRGPKGTKKAKA